MSVYGTYPIAKSVQSAIVFNSEEERISTARALYRAGARSLNLMGLMYFTPDGKEALRRVLNPEQFIYAQKHAEENTLVRGIPVTVVWKSDEDDLVGAAWMCKIEKVYTDGEYDVRCLSDNSLWAISTHHDEIYVSPGFKNMPASFIETSIADIEGGKWIGNFTEDGILHGDVVYTPANTSVSMKGTYDNGTLVVAP